MSRNYPNDTQSQKALQEIYEKQNSAALRFFLQNFKADELTAPKLAAMKEVFQIDIPEKYSKLLEERKNRRPAKRQEPNYEDESGFKTKEFSAMRPPSSSTKDLLFGKHGER